ncbi:MAG: cytochrome c3 family protein [Actinomycetota bacterium]|nr:cytochrome c3 family protein [Actinomycetota bacterium]
MNLQGFGLNDLLNTVVNVVRDPTANLTAAVLLLAALTIVLLILVLLALAVIMRPARTEHAPLIPAERSPEDLRGLRHRRDIVALGILASVAVGLGIGYVQIVRTGACLSCHASSADVSTSWSEGAHAGAECWDCHGGGTIANGLVARMEYVRWVRSPVDPAKSTRRASVVGAACLRCHEDVLGELVETTDLKMSHAEPYDAGYECTDCHNQAGHAVRFPRKGSRMALCLDCHDGKKADATCTVCHVTDVSRISGTPPERFPKVELGPPTDCRGCHSIKTCNDCHGLEMPHPRQFATTGAHAKQAGFEKQRLCTKCHDIKGFCNRCHQFGEAHGGASWRAEHGSQANAVGRASCIACHHRSKDFCALCHK